MKLLKTIQGLVREAEDRYYKASINPNITQKEIEYLEKKLDESLSLLELYNDLDEKE